MLPKTLLTEPDKTVISHGAYCKNQDLDTCGAFKQQVANRGGNHIEILTTFGSAATLQGHAETPETDQTSSQQALKT